jgi:tRNA(Ser,Leu) C12 N-acetylase TAN1
VGCMTARAVAVKAAPAASIPCVVRLEGGVFARLDWNLVVTAHGGRRHDLIHALRPIVKLTRAGYSEVLIGKTPDVDACLAGIAARAETDAVFAGEILARVVPVTRTFMLAAEIEPQLVAETATLLDAVAGNTFHVRVERRGHRRLVQSDQLERRLGTALVAALAARGETPRVTFDDPDLIVAVELIGDAAGIGLVPRAWRQRHRFVRL